MSQRLDLIRIALPDRALVIEGGQVSDTTVLLHARSRRQMYGRAGFELLKARVMPFVEPPLPAGGSTESA
jgi:hypothetical protein